MAVVLTGCRGTTADAPPPAGIPVKIATLASGNVSERSEYLASIESRQSVELRPQIEGRISAIFVKSGDKVAANTRLVRIDPARQQATVDSGLAAVESARSDVATAKATLLSLEAERKRNQADLNLRKLEFGRSEKLAAKGDISAEDFDLRKNNLDVAAAVLDATLARITAQEAAVMRAESALAKAEADSNEQKVQLAYFSVEAPFSGRIGDIPAKVGDYVTPATSLLVLTQNDSLLLNVSVPVERASRLRIGMPVEVLNGLGEKTGDATISFIAPNADPRTQSVLIKAALPNPAGALRADQFARARIVWEQTTGITIPVTALLRIAGQDFVFLIQPGAAGATVKQQPVKVGEIAGNDCRILDGLKAGDRIAITGILKLADGAPVIEEK